LAVEEEGRRVLGYIEHLAVKIGARGATSRAERNAAQYLAEELEKTADQVVVQPFRSLSSTAGIYLVHYILMMLVALFSSRYPLPVAILATANIVGYLRQTIAREFVGRLLLRDKSQNVIAVKRRAGERRLPRVVMVAHYDTARPHLFFHPSLVGAYRTIFSLTNVAMAAILLLAMAQALAASPGMILPGFFNHLPLPFALYLAFVSLPLLQSLLGGEISGANDNASGVAVMMTAFSKLKEQMPEGAELWAVATGCGHAGATGMQGFLEEYGDQIRNDYIINLDSLGAGTLIYITGEGLLQTLPADRELMLAAAAFARKNPGIPVRGSVYKDMLGDGTLAIIKGYKAMSIMGLDEKGNVPNRRWPSDTMENISEDNLFAGVQLVQSLARQLWRQE
jgi:hypothetical protein